MDDGWLYPVNDLERALLDAASDPEDASRTSAFFAALVASDLFVVADVAGSVDVVGGEATLPPGTLVTPRAATIEGEEVLPVYSSRERIEAATSGEFPYVAMAAPELLANVEDGMKMVINPGVWHGKELWPEEIATLLADVLPPPGEQVVAGDTRVAVGHPAEWPQAMADVLSELFAEHPSVGAAYIALVGLPGSMAALTVGLDMRDPSAIEAIASLIGSSIEPADVPVNVVSIDGNPIGDWMKANADPFYQAP